MAEQADALDLKSNVAKATYRFDPGHRHHIYRGVEQLVARRAHNPEAVWFKSHLRNQTKQSTVRKGGAFVLRTVKKRDLNGLGSE